MQAWALTVGDNPVQARPQFEAILAQYPTSAGAMEGVAVTNAIDVLNYTAADPKGQLEIAERMIGEAQKLRPNSARVHYIKGVTLRAGGRYEDALVSLEHALTLNQGFTHVHAMVGETMMKLGRVEEGLDRLDQAMRLSPNDGSFGLWLTSVGYGHLLLGRYDESAGFLRRAVDRRPGAAAPLAWLTAAEMLRGNREAAETAAREFRRHAPRGDTDRLVGRASLHPSYPEQSQRLLDAMRQAGIDAPAEASNR
jgi:tetratricopeptide (TPR) repeat protein